MVSSILGDRHGRPGGDSGVDDGAGGSPVKLGAMVGMRGDDPAAFARYAKRLEDAGVDRRRAAALVPDQLVEGMSQA
jgi:hypothetical protein